MEDRHTLGKNLWLYFSFCLLCKSAMGSILKCDQRCGSTHIPYPFSITRAECGHHLFHNLLRCKSNSTLLLRIGSGEYTVLGISQKSIIVDPLASRSNCSNHNVAAFNFNFTKLAISYENFLILYSCKNTTACANNCFFNGSMVQWFNASKLNTNMCGNPSCCYDMHYADRHFLQSMNLSSSNCTTFTSWVTSFQKGNDSEITVEVDYGLELEWAFPKKYCRDLKCQKNSQSRPGHVVDGCRCECLDGYEGDPYNSGCVRTCNKADRSCECPNGRLPGSNSCKPPRLKSSKAVLCAGILAGATVLAGILIAFALLARRNSRVCERRVKGDISQLATFLSRNCSVNKTTLFTFKELDKATKGFAESQILGNGGHGTVYAGKLQDGCDIAVKKYNRGNINGIDQVMNEVMVLLSVNHPNLVRLLGCCLELGDPLLVYEYVPNGTLSQHLQRQRGAGLDWFTRITIATEASHALAYLHNHIDPPIFHRDVKSSNILLDYEYNTKVADFGLSKLVLSDASNLSTCPQGTPGYLDPEYHQSFQLSDKSDVYSFGVVLIELITAMKVVDFTREKQEVNLAALALAKIHSGTLDDIIDPFLQVDKNPLTRCMVHRVSELAFRCLSSEKDARPTMREVEEELEAIRIAGLLPGEESPVRDNKEHESFRVLPR